MSTSFERRLRFREEIDEQRKIEYAFGFFDTETFEGTLVNMSDAGICLLISRPLKTGAEITVKDDIFGSPRTATVQWIEKTDEGQYKVGFTF
jgi:hypothetical protein